MPKPIINLEEASKLAKNLNKTEVEEIKQPQEGKESEEIFEYINNIMNGKYHGIGIHSIRNVQSRDRAEEILRHGLKLKEKEGVLSTVSSFGTHTEITRAREKERILNYSYGNQSQERISVVVLVPSIISNTKGESTYLGFPEYNTECSGNNYRTSCVLDSVCKAQGKIPKEFILGYFVNKDDKFKFIGNPEYYSLLDEKEKDKIFLEIEEYVKGKPKEVSDAVILGDTKKLEELSRTERKKVSEKIKKITEQNILERGCNKEVAESLAEKTVTMNKDDSATQALLFVETREMEEGKKTLTDLYIDTKVKTSDLPKGKNILREGIEQNRNKNVKKEENNGIQL